MKHGPIALLDQSTPVVVVATESPVLEKVISNIQEVRARGARVIAIATEGDEQIGQHADEVIGVPQHAVDAGAAAGGDPAAAAGVPHRPPARAERRPAAEPRQDRDGGVSAERGGPDRSGPTASGSTCSRSSGSSGRSSGRPRLAERLFTEAERAYAASRGRPGQHLAARFCAKEAVAKALGLEAWNFHDVEMIGTGGPPRIRLSGAAAARAAELGVQVEVSLTHTGRDAAAVAVAG